MNQGFAQNVSLAPYSTYHIGGKAKYLVHVYDTDSLLRALELSEKRLILGRGSKILISDSGFDGVVIIMRASAARFSNGSVYVESGMSLPILSRIFANRGLKGLEWACGIPASVGGAIKLNAGAYGGDMSKIVLSVDVLRDDRIITLNGDECGFMYRGSGFYPNDIILGARLRAENGDREEIDNNIKIFTQKRLESQPKGYCCGSVFKAADKPAYTYIIGCGLQGMSVGDAVISTKHANFIINRGYAKAKDVYTLIQTIKAEVFAKYGVKLKEEVIYIGEF